MTLGCLVTGLALLAIFRADWENVTVTSVLVAMASVVGLAVLLNCRTWWQVADSVLHSQRKRLHSAADSMHKLKSEGFMKVRQGPQTHTHIYTHRYTNTHIYIHTSTSTACTSSRARAS